MVRHLGCLRWALRSCTNTRSPPPCRPPQPHLPRPSVRSPHHLQLNVTALNSRDPAGRWHCERSYKLTLAEGRCAVDGPHTHRHTLVLPHIPIRCISPPRGLPLPHTHCLPVCSVQIFFVDTSPFIDRYRTAPWAHCAGGILQQSWQEQLAELEGHLAASTAAWKLVVGHHPPRSNGEHGNNTELMLHLEPLLLQHGVQVRGAGVCEGV